MLAALIPSAYSKTSGATVATVDAIAGTEFVDSRAAIAETNYQRVSALSRAIYRTRATSMIVDAYSDIQASYPLYASLGVKLDGANLCTLPCRSAGANRFAVALPPGEKDVEIVTGLTTDLTGFIRGTYLTGVGFSSTATLQTPSATGRILVYGDSIAVGDNGGETSASPALVGWANLLRGLVPVSVAVEGHGRRSLYDDSTSEPTYTNWKAAMASYAPAIVWMAIGTNDYGLNHWPASNFGGAYAVVLDDLHAAIPGAHIYCQTPLPRTSPSSEAANGNGSTLGNYRTQIATAVSTRTTFCTLVDGTALGVALSSDGLHPSVAGHASYAAAVAAELGY